MSFAEATGYDSTLNNGQPENDESNLGWYGYTTPSASVIWYVQVVLRIADGADLSHIQCRDVKPLHIIITCKSPEKTHVHH